MALRLGTLVDRFYKQQEVVKAKGRIVSRAETEKKREQIKLTKIGNTIQDRFSNQEIQGFETPLAKAELKPVTGFNIKDWVKLTAWVHKQRAYEVFQRRLNKATILEHIEARKNRPIPGVKRFKKVTLVVTKGKGKR